MGGETLRLLIVDDSVADARLLESFIHQAMPDGCLLRHAKTVEPGLTLLDREKFDCVLLDYDLDDAQGIDLLRAIRDRGDDTPVVMVSGKGDESVAVEALKSGAQDYVVKGSITPEAIKRALGNAIERVALERQIAEKREDLECFAHVAAHDLRGPLCSIHSLVSLLIEGLGGQCDKEAKFILGRVERSATRMNTLLDGLLEYASVGRSSKPMERVDLGKALYVVLENLESRIQQAGAVVDHTTMPTVKGDEIALVQLLQNLISNAIKFRGERTPVVTVSAETLEDTVVLSIADNGIGIAAEDRDRIFAPFRRLHSQSDYEGSGIGLATCKRIIDQHGGEIRVESEEGRGTTFRCMLPNAEPVSPEKGLSLSDIESA